MTPTAWWFELGRLQRDDILTKLAQAQGDVDDAVEAEKDPPWTRPVAVVRKTGSPIKRVALHLGDLIAALDCDSAVWDLPSWTWDMPIVIEYGAFLRIVEMENARGK